MKRTSRGRLSRPSLSSNPSSSRPTWNTSNNNSRRTSSNSITSNNNNSCNNSKTSSNHISKKRKSSIVNAESIQVIVRCRGRNDFEIQERTPEIVKPIENASSKISTQVSIESNDLNDQEFHTTLSSVSSSIKTYTVDQVLGPGADQTVVFASAALPLFNEFMKGYNCTMLAYGQTGSGKTYTMSGDTKFSKDNELLSEAGVIPRILHKLFNIVDDENYCIKCSFVEIYNEELCDLLSESSSSSGKLRIYDDKSSVNGGNSSSIKIHGLEEFQVKSAAEGLDLLKQGVQRRKTSSTKMNNRSSRSHSIFIISMMKKEKNGEYLFSRLNLVDLAGSEDILRSGATELRAREAGSINQSLLTLGKVINSLVDGSSHIPYRDSKLTHILRDSLGGNTKTVLIANISPTLLDYHATSSTLEYASKAKNVQNIAQIGPLIAEENVVNKLLDENHRLKKDLKANRSKKGVFLDEENYNNLMKDYKSLNTEIEELKRSNESLNNKLDAQIKKVDIEKQEKNDIKESLSLTENILVKTQNQLSGVQNAKIELENSLNELIEKCELEIENKKRLHTDISEFLSSNVSQTKSLFTQIGELDKIVGLNEISQCTSTINNCTIKLKELLKNSSKLMETRLQELREVEEHLDASAEGLREQFERSNNLIQSSTKANCDLHTFLSKDLLHSNNISILKQSLIDNAQIDVQKFVESQITPALNSFFQTSLSQHVNEIIKGVGTNLEPNVSRWFEKSKDLELLKQYNESIGTYVNSIHSTSQQQLLNPMLEQLSDNTFNNSARNELNLIDGNLVVIQDKQIELDKFNEKQIGKKKEMIDLVTQINENFEDKNKNISNASFSSSPIAKRPLEGNLSQATRKSSRPPLSISKDYSISRPISRSTSKSRTPSPSKLRKQLSTTTATTTSSIPKLKEALKNNGNSVTILRKLKSPLSSPTKLTNSIPLSKKRKFEESQVDLEDNMLVDVIDDLNDQ